MAIDASIYDGFPRHAFRPPVDRPHDVAPVVVLGAGPIGLTLALGLARHGVPSIVVEPRDTVGFGSRAICLSRRSLEIWDRLGVVRPILERGLAWTGGRSYWGRAEVLAFAMPHDDDEKFPPMLNLQQCFVEQTLIDAALATPEIDLRWQSTAVVLDANDAGVRLTIETPEGRYDLAASRVVACDGARSFARRALGLAMRGTSYEGRYLIADVRFASDAPVERRAWFDPPSNPRSTLLMHRQPDDIWRIDYQLRDDEDEAEAAREDAVRARIDAHLAYIGETPDYTLMWTSLYKAHAVTLERYVHGRVVFAGDAAHLVPIFGVRGLNSGIDDAFNLAWKLALVASGRANDTLLESYSRERVFAAHENIRQSRKSTLFMTPPTPGYELMRDAALSLAVDAPFARALVDPRQSAAIAFPDSPLSSDDVDAWRPDAVRSGAVLPHVRVLRNGATAHLGDFLGTRPLLVAYGADAIGDAERVANAGAPSLVPFDVVTIRAGGDAGIADAFDRFGSVARRLDLAPGGLYLIRPDGHVAARRRRLTPEGFAELVARVSLAVGAPSEMSHAAHA